MAKNAEQQLVTHLSEARAHELQTKEHVRYLEERLEAHGQTPSKIKDLALQGAALGIGIGAQAAPDTPIRLATTAFAFENLEIAAYRLIGSLARRAADLATLEVVERILEQEEAAAELVAGSFERLVQLTLDEEPTAPLPPLTPIGKPSERDIRDEHEGPQSFKDTPPGEPVDTRGHVYTPTEPPSSPDAGYPVDDTEPYGDGTPSERIPANIGEPQRRR